MKNGRKNIEKVLKMHKLRWSGHINRKNMSLKRTVRMIQERLQAFQKAHPAGGKQRIFVTRRK